MRKYAISICLVIGMFVLSSQAFAEVIFDTGTPLDDKVLGYFECGHGFAT